MVIGTLTEEFAVAVEVTLQVVRRSAIHSPPSPADAAGLLILGVDRSLSFSRSVCIF